jgi:hypothetical protein
MFKGQAIQEEFLRYLRSTLRQPSWLLSLFRQPVITHALLYIRLTINTNVYGVLLGFLEQRGHVVPPETSKIMNKRCVTFENSGYIIYIAADTCKHDLFWLDEQKEKASNSERKYYLT